VCQNVRPCERRFFSEYFVFASFGNWLFSNFGNILVMSEPSELIPTQKIAKKLPFTEISESNKKITFNLSRLDSRKLVPTQKPTQSSVKSSECRALPKCLVWIRPKWLPPELKRKVLLHFDETLYILQPLSIKWNFRPKKRNWKKGEIQFLQISFSVYFTRKWWQT